MLSCRPNPLNNNTEITYNLPENGKVLLQLFDIRGTLIKTLVNATQPFGLQTLHINNETLPAGMYFLKLIFTNSKGSIIQSIKIIRSDI